MSEAALPLARHDSALLLSTQMTQSTPLQGERDIFTPASILCTPKNREARINAGSSPFSPHASRVNASVKSREPGRNSMTKLAVKH